VEVIKPELWLGDSDFVKQNPIRAVITDLVSGTNKWGKPEYQLFLRLENQQIKKSSLYGSNLNALIEKYGTDSSKWISKGVEIWRIEDLNQKVVRELRPL
jgi:hypothetical protein